MGTKTGSEACKFGGCMISTSGLVERVIVSRCPTAHFLEYLNDANLW